MNSVPLLHIFRARQKRRSNTALFVSYTKNLRTNFENCTQKVGEMLSKVKLDSEMFNKALNAYVSDDKKNLLNLSKYAKEMHVYTKMMNVMEVLLNG